MGRWLLETFPTWLLGAAFMILPAALAAAVALVLGRRWTRGAGGDFKETGTALLMQTLAIYGLVLAFVIVNQYGDFNQTRQDVQTEALNVEDVYRSSLAFEAAEGSAVSAAVGRYVTSVVDQEWPALSEGESSAETAAAFTNLYVVLKDNAPTDPAQLIAYGNALTYLHTAHDARHRRVDAASDTLPGILNAFLLLGALASVVYTLLLGMRRHQLVVPMSLAALLGFTLLLSLTLEHPFSGDSGISSVHFTQGSLATFFPGR